MFSQSLTQDLKAIKMLMEEMKFLSTMTLVEETPEVTMTTETEMTTLSIRTLWTMISPTINGTSNDNVFRTKI